MVNRFWSNRLSDLQVRYITNALLAKEKEKIQYFQVMNLPNCSSESNNQTSSERAK